MADVGEVELRIDALSVHIHGKGDDIHIAGALAVAKERALHTVRPSHQAELRAGHAGAPVVVRVQADDRILAVFQVFDKVLDLIGVAVGGAHLHSGGQVQDDLVLRGGLERLHHLFADEDGVLRLRAGKALRGVLIGDMDAVALGVLRELADELGAVDGDIDDAVHILFKDHLALEGGGGVIEVEDDVLGALDGLKRLFDQVLARLDKHLDGHIVRDMAALDERAQDLVLRLRRGGEADLDLLKSDIHQHVEHLELFLQIHRVDKRLVAVAQIHTAPDGGLGNHLIGPLAVFNLHRGKRHILFASFKHVNSPSRFNMMGCSAEAEKQKTPPPGIGAGTIIIHAVPP